MEEAGGKSGFGWDRALVVPSCPVHVPPPDLRAGPGQKATKKKAKREMRGFKYRLQTGGVWRRGGLCIHVCVCVCVL